MRTPRIHGDIVDGTDIRTKRLKPLGKYEIVGDFDCSESIMEFQVPSDGTQGRVYIVRVDAKTCEIACPCVRFHNFRNASNSPVKDIDRGTMLEQMCRLQGLRWLPSVTRPPKGLCRHGKLCRSWLKRHGILPALEHIEKILIEDLAARRSA